MSVITADQRTTEWHDLHNGRITASIAAACLGLCPYTSRQKAWRTILGTEKHESNPAMRFGIEFEPIARQAYEIATGELVTETGFWIHDRLPWCGASPDGLVNDKGLVEIKVPGTLPTAVPIHHRIQMLVQLAVTGRDWCDYFCWTHEGFFLRRVHRAGIDGLLRKLQAFYETFVLTLTAPPRKKPKRKKVVT